MEMDYTDEFGFQLPRWKPLEPGARGRHATFASAVAAAVGDLATEHDDFFDSLADRWPKLFPNCPARPGRYDSGRIILYVRSAPALFAFRPRLREVKRVLSALPGAPKRVDLVLEIRK